MKKILLFSLCSVLFFSCSDEILNDEQVKELVTQANSSHYFECTVFDDFKTLNEEVSKKYTKSLYDKSKKWAYGEVIRIKFLDGSELQQGFVKHHAKKWLVYANLTFEWVNSNQTADIKISFKPGTLGGNSSAVGTDSKKFAQNKASMNLPAVDSYIYPESESLMDIGAIRAVLHEFGHALSLNHEHQHPNRNFTFKFPDVYNYYEKRGWTKKEVDNFLVNVLNSSNHVAMNFDKKSIMIYDFNPDIIIPGRYFESLFTSSLSSVDKSNIMRMYPKSYDEKTGWPIPKMLFYTVIERIGNERVAVLYEIPNKDNIAVEVKDYDASRY